MAEIAMRDEFMNLPMNTPRMNDRQKTKKIVDLDKTISLPSSRQLIKLA